MRITNQTPHQPPSVTAADLNGGDAFILVTETASTAPTVYILFDTRSYHPDDGRQAWCVEFRQHAMVPLIRAIPLTTPVQRVRLIRLDIELLPQQVAL